MGLFDFLKQKSNGGQYVSEIAFNNNRDKQIKMAPQTLEELRKINVAADMELKLEYFFYTNSEEKAIQLATELKKLNYQVDHHLAADSKKEYVITGWTTKMKMAESVVVEWAKQMCDLGYKFDCDFDGWGTSPDQ